MNILFNSLTVEEFRCISIFEIAKKACDLLEVTHEGTTAIKIAKLQWLTTSFENLYMDESETFDIFYAKLSDIINSSFNLGERITESHIVHKILRSLPDRFQPKVTTIEESKNIDLLKVE